MVIAMNDFGMNYDVHLGWLQACRYARYAGACCALALLSMALVLVGCTGPTLQSVSADIVKYGPIVDSAIEALGSAAALADPAIAPILLGVQPLYATASTALINAAKQCALTCTGTFLTQLEQAITALESQVNASLLAAVGVKNAGSQAYYLKLINGIASVVNLFLAWLTAVLPSGALTSLAAATPVKIAQIRQYLDDGALQSQLARVDSPYAAPQVIGYLQQQGF